MKKVSVMKASLIASLALVGLSGCSVYREAIASRPDLNQPWRAIATDADRDRLRNWRKAWTEGLEEAEKGHAATLAADPLLFDPDRAQSDASIATGTYQCRIVKLGVSGVGTQAYATSPTARCAIQPLEGALDFRKLDGDQRPVGNIFEETPARSIFLGTLVFGDETAPLRYGLDAQRDLIGYVERIDAKRWRLVVPYPRFESKLAIIEISAP